jgi:hypothetical protein
MTKTSGVNVFISYAHSDKVAARRVVRELTSRRIGVWIDERELRLGAALTASIKQQIDEAEAVVVVASTASSNST